MKDLTSLFIGGKQIGANCLREAVKADFSPAFVIANSDDTGQDSWHESLVRVAGELGLDCVKGNKVKDADVVARITAAKPDIIFCIGSTELIPESVLAVPKIGTINIHPALLPKYRGRYSIPHAIFNGEKETGVTLHFMDKSIDSGPIISQASYTLSDDDTARTAYDSFTEVGTRLFKEFLALLASGADIPSRVQDESQATYYPKGLPNNGELDWSWDGAAIRRFIRAMTFEPFPPASFMLGDRKFDIVEDKSFTARKPGATK